MSHERIQCNASDCFHVARKNCSACSFCFSLCNEEGKTRHLGFFPPRVVLLKLLNTVVVLAEQWKPIIETESDVNFSVSKNPVVSL